MIHRLCKVLIAGLVANSFLEEVESCIAET